MRQVQALGEIRFATLARAAEGLTQWRPLLMGFLTLLATAAIMFVGQLLALRTSGLLGLVVMLAALVVLLGGSSGVGIMLMDKARNEPVRSFAAAASAGLLCLPRFLLFALVIFLTALAYMVVAALVYFVCKIPVIGALLAFVAHPVLVLVAAAILICLIGVVGPLMAPALWSGLSVKAALANVLSIARARLIEVVLMEVVLYVILSLICVMLFAGFVPATFSLTAMALNITGSAGGGMGVYGPMAMFMGNGAGMGLVAGLGVLYCVVGALLTQVMIMGMNLIYLQARESVDPGAAEEALDDLLGDVRQKAEEVRERTMAAAERAKQAAQEHAARVQAAATATEPQEPAEATQKTGQTSAPPSCPACHAAIAADDSFCSACGHRLR
ncbi:hypothetical protein [Comamonas guangdongensis]|uniref:Zinc ribbon domain-containing protein n=1 Tax=Comamonas guangdongensis TaxID=510515 RepID=A0ABV3ZYA8_9BURK